MQVFIVLLIFGIFLLFYLLAKVSGISHAHKELGEDLKLLEIRLDQLQQELKSKETKPENRASSADPDRSPPISPSPVSTSVPPFVPPIRPAPPLILARIAESAAPISKTTPPHLAGVKPLSTPPDQRTSFTLPSFNWEQFMGVKFFAYVGGLAAFLFVALGLKYSFEHNLIPPEVRVAVGYLLGAGLLVGGVLLSRRDYRVLAQTLCATGVVILYAVAFACRSIYHFPFFDTIPTFLLMVLITTTAFLLAVRLNAMVVAVLGMLGGFLTPILVSTGQDNPLGLFGYIALLDAGLIAVVLNRRWNWLALLAALGTVFMQIGWVDKFYSPEKVFVAQGVFLGFCSLFLLAFYLARRRNQNDGWFAISGLLLPAVTLGFSLYLLSLTEFQSRPGIVFTFVFAADLCVLAIVVLDAKLFAANMVSGMAVFGVLGLWMGDHLSNSLLNWALGLSFLFAILHSGFPIVLRRIKPETPSVWWTNLFPAFALILIMVPIVKLSDVSFAVWPCVFLIDALAVLLAMLTGYVLAVVLVLLLTLGATALWVCNLSAEVTGLPSVLLVIGAGAVFFFVAGIFATEKIMAKRAKLPEGGAGWEPSPEVAAQLPAMAALLPFLLLVLVTLRLPLANISPVFGLALMLTVLLLGLAVRLKFDWLPAAGLLGVLALEHAWHFRHFLPDNAAISLAWYLIFYAVFACFPFVFWKRFADQTAPWAAAGLAGPLHFYLVYSLVKQAYPNGFMGLLPTAFALTSMTGLFFLVKRIMASSTHRNAQLAWMGGVALFFVTLIFPVQFHREWITLGWALEGAALLWLYRRVPHGGLRWTGIALLAVAFVRLALNGAVLDYHLRSGTPIWNWYLYAYTITAGCLLVGAKLMAPPRNFVSGINIPPILNTMGTILIFLLLNIEIADYFSEDTSLTFKFSGNFARDMTYTIAWSLFAFVLLVLGIRNRSRPVRIASIGLLTVAVLKLFVHDLDNLGQLYRLGALISVAIIAMLASFVYQRFLNLKSGPSSPISHEPPESPK